ncbi:MBL fold metallo-hydrolase [Streptoverticillium reticulum]|uniref:MBL fold metallo-hydrolase n=1 Tax=Streptoverticillium reticulum TaxID=1433415 RepID=UPI0039BF710D
MQLITLGVVGGPPPVAGHYGTSSALVVNGRAYVIDCGRGSVSQFYDAGLTIDDLGGIFLTHLHADHIAEYYNYFMLADNPLGMLDVKPRKIPVYGPGPAGGLSRDTALGQRAPVVGTDPTPGIRKLTQDCDNAYAYTANILARDGLDQIPQVQRAIHEIAVPPDADYKNTAPLATRPIHVMETDDFEVTAVLVPHYSVFPSYAFRFDFDNKKSIVFSGDTRRSTNVAYLAHETDILVHEAYDPDAILAAITPSNPPKGFRLNPEYMEMSHTPSADVGKVAQEAGAKRVVLNHLAPVTVPDNTWKAKVAPHYRGPVQVAHDNRHYRLETA